MTTLDITPVVENSIQNKQGVLEFTIKNVNVSIVNGLRRTLLTNIPSSVIDSKQSEFYTNTGRLHNEILKQRLDCIPVHIKDTSVLSDLLLEVDMVNDTDMLMYLTTRDFKIKNISTDTYLTDEAVEQIFPPNKLTKSLYYSQDCVLKYLMIFQVKNYILLLDLKKEQLKKMEHIML